MSLGNVKDNKLYSNEHVAALIKKNIFKESQEYINTYFAKIEDPVGIVKYDPVNRKDMV